MAKAATFFRDFAAQSLVGGAQTPLPEYSRLSGSSRDLKLP